MIREFSFGIVELKKGDITEEKVDAIVNAANSGLMGGGGVDGAIHRAGGPAIIEECKEIIGRIGRLPPGKTVITTAGKLPSGKVIHTVGPIWRGGGDDEERTLSSCYGSSLKLAMKNHVKSIAFPSISTGAYGYPVEEAASVAMKSIVQVMKEGNRSIELVKFVLFDQRTFSAYERALREII
jgi:O-acetyl-ADP-ribose deacetylase